MKRPDSPSWKAAKAAGDEAELLVAREFGLRGFDCHRTIGKAAYDLLLTARVEVKHDLCALSSGRVAVEVSCAGEPSGIMDTLATFWTFIVGDLCIIIPTKRLRDLAQRPDYDEVSAGDGRKTRCKLVPLEVLRNAPHARTLRLPERAA
jgi:hypothetical protein